MTGEPSVVAHVVGLWRYPVKSLAGESMDELCFDERGAERDRLWALVDVEGGIASGKTTRRFRKVPGLLRHESRMTGELPVITLADGRSARIDTAQAARLVREIAGPRWSIQRERSVSHFDAAPVHLVTTSTLAALSAGAGTPITAERLRPTILLDCTAPGFPEDDWVGHTLRIGELRLRVVHRTERCVMVNHARAALPARRDVLKTIGRLNRACAGVYAEVLAPGTVRLGDATTVGGR